MASTSRSVVTCEVRSVRFLWALSMMPSRSCSTRSESMVLRVVCSIDWPTRWVTVSSRSLTARAMSAWRPASACPIASTRPVASLWARSISLKRSSSSTARMACATASSAPRRPDRAITMAMIVSNVSASAPKPISAAPVWTGRSPIMKRISFMGALVADSSANANEEGTFMVNRRLIFVVKDALTGGEARIDPGKSAA